MAESCLQLCPGRRPCAADVLQMPWFEKASALLPDDCAASSSIAASADANASKESLPAVPEVERPHGVDLSKASDPNDGKHIGAEDQRGLGDIRSFVHKIPFGANMGGANNPDALAITGAGLVRDNGSDPTVPGASLVARSRVLGATAKRKRMSSTGLSAPAQKTWRRLRRKTSVMADAATRRKRAKNEPAAKAPPVPPKDEADAVSAAKSMALTQSLPGNAMDNKLTVSDAEDDKERNQANDEPPSEVQDANGEQRAPGSTRMPCTVPGCEQPMLRAGYCYRHQVNRMPKPLLMVKACSEAGPQVLEKLVPVDIIAFLESMQSLRGRFPPAEEMVLEFILAVLKEPEACMFFTRACKSLPRRFSEADLRLALLRTPGP